MYHIHKVMIRNFNVKPVLNGYICHVGCQTVVFNSKKALLRTLEEYLDKPAEVEQQFIKEAINPMGPIDLGATEAPIPTGNYNISGPDAARAILNR